MKELKIHHVSLKMSQQKEYFFHDLNIILAPGLYFVTGKNGVGKSTLFRLISGSLLPGEIASGSIEIDRIMYHYDDHNSLPEQYIKQVGHITQKTDSMLVSEFSGEENLRFALLDKYPLLKFLPAHKKLPSFFFGLEIDLRKPIKQLSGGQRQIISILMMLQKETSVLLLDEPTAALDPNNTVTVIEFVEKLAIEQKIIALIITHDMDIIDRYGAGTTLVINADRDGKRFIDFE